MTHISSLKVGSTKMWVKCNFLGCLALVVVYSANTLYSCNIGCPKIPQGFLSAGFLSFVFLQQLLAGSRVGAEPQDLVKAAMPQLSCLLRLSPGLSGLIIFLWSDYFKIDFLSNIVSLSLTRNQTRQFLLILHFGF